MLTKKENLLETIKCGNPDRFVKQYEPFHLVMCTPNKLDAPLPVKGGEKRKNGWGVWLEWPENTPGFFPIHDAEHLVIKDIEHWKDYVKAPRTSFSDAEYEPAFADIESVDRNEQLITLHQIPGIFEQCHYLGEITNTLTNFYTNPDEMHELIKYILEYELAITDELCSKLKPDVILHHDDWGTQLSTFMSPDMFEEFFLEPYRELYGFYKEKGVMIMHHADCYCATFIDYMVDLGIDIWQGAISTNNIPELVARYGDKITIMGGVDNGILDTHDWSEEKIYNHVRDICMKTGPRGFIPSTCAGRDACTYPGVYEAINKAIDRVSAEYFKSV